MSTYTKQDLISIINEANHKFTADVYKALQRNDNLVFSPISAQVALILAYVGADCNTAKEISNVLHLSLENKHLLRGMKLFLDQLKCATFIPVVEIFIDKKYNLKSSYRQTLKKYLDSSTPIIDFKNPVRAARIINLWVQKHTDNKIENLYSESSFDTSTNLVLVNTIYFKDHWLRRFEHQNTKILPFHSLSNSTVDVFMMHTCDVFRYTEKELYKILELPYNNHNFRMMIFLPHKKEDFHLMEKEMQNVNFAEVERQMKYSNVKLKLPAFEVQHSIDYVDILRDLGVHSMFKKHAYFFNMYENTELPLCVDSIFYKGIIDVDKDGTTGGVFGAHLCKPKTAPQSPVLSTREFHADHPFIFYILHKDTILFMGRVCEFPNEDEVPRKKYCVMKCFWKN